MTKHPFLSGLLALGLTAPTVVALSGVASAAATVTRFTFGETEVFPDTPAECMPVVKSGETRAVLTGTGQITENSNGYAVHWQDTFVYTTTFSDGSYLTGTARHHHAEASHGAVTVQTDVVREPRTIYAADGTVVGEVIIHAMTHTTTDNATGETTVAFDRFFFTCH